MKAIFYDWGGANVWLFHAVNRVHYELLDYAMLLGTELGAHEHFPLYLSFLAMAALIAVSRSPLADSIGSRANALRWLLAIGVFSMAYVLDAVLVGWLKHLLDFPRPPLALPLGSVTIIGTPEYRHSFPSGHASFAMLVAASLWPVLGRAWRVVAGLFVLWVCLSRVSLGAHFPADVLAGCLLSLALVVVVRTSLRLAIPAANRMR
jgi:membrane-associated phospholipid phosphatase